ncbi:type II toxin-antitoxin system HicB family antitoxin [Laspinema sp. D1]|uniref:Type II toxin-antitoxin system HicB family antitoxin n=1 Tax=Laspinema palackyanum D2a TaxID=2953684 RepID=A0ABT2MPP6_9CYAN|nr:type II toxin-antitoxin system HicB family antitoxin [Laspinema sp. D2a]
MTNLLNIQVKKTTETNWNTFTLTVLISEQSAVGYQATVLGWSDCQGSGVTKEEAIANLNQAINTRLETTEIASLKIVNSNAQHPWMKFAGMHEENPLFEEVLAFIESDRQQLDIEMEDYYQQLDEEMDASLSHQFDEEDGAPIYEDYAHQFDEEDEAQFDEAYEHQVDEDYMA